MGPSMAAFAYAVHGLFLAGTGWYTRRMPPPPARAATLVLLAAGAAVSGLVCGWTTAPAGATFNAYAVEGYALQLVLLLLAGVLIGGLRGRHGARAEPGPTIAAILGLLIFAIPLHYLIEALLGSGVVIWAGLVLLQTLRWALRGLAPALAAWLIVVGVAVLPRALFVEDLRAWSEPPPVETLLLDHADAEALLHGQSARVEDAVARLAAQRPGVEDVYFLAVGGDATQAVFMREALYTQALFERRFGAQGRALSLINHPDTTATLPLASATNLRATLAGIGQRLDPAEDMLVLYLTSHGSPDHRFSLYFPPLPLVDIRPDELRTALDEAGIGWRVLIVSACYSGGFIDALRGPRTVVITAAAADRTSFGCSNENDFTYFGGALVRDALGMDRDLVAAFETAAAAVTKREEQEGLPASLPQIDVGDEMAAKLRALSRPADGD